MTDRQEDPIRAQLIKARRAQILDAAAEVFAEKGFARATTKEVASKAGVSEGTIYNYFGSKEDLLIGLMNRLGDVQLRRMHFTSDQLAQALKQDAHDFLRGVLQTRHGFVARSKTMLGAIVAEMLINREFAERYYEQTLLPYSESLAQHLQARIERGEIRPMDVSLLLRFFSAVNIGLLVGLLIGDDLLQAQWQDEAFIEALTDFFMYGISVERKPDRDE
jgi:AcrR family transcriptional regulator